VGVRHGWGHGLIEEGHWEVAEIKKLRFNPLSLTELLKNPLRRLFGKAALTCAADDYGDCHIVLSLVPIMREERPEKRKELRSFHHGR
jgi:hypothetical protein